MASRIKFFLDSILRLSFKNPLVYISVLASISIYYIAYRFQGRQLIYGILERTISTKVFFVFFVSLFLYAAVTGSTLIAKIKSLYIRLVLLLGMIIIATIFVLPAWMVNEYDNEKMTIYFRILPLKISPKIEFRETVYYSDIQSLETKSGGGDSGGSLVLIRKNGSRQSISSGSIPRYSLTKFLKTLYDECDWLQDDIEREYGPIEKRIAELNNKDFLIRRDGVSAAFSILAIWGVMVILAAVVRKIVL